MPTNEQTTYSILPHNIFNRMVQATLEDVEEVAQDDN